MVGHQLHIRANTNSKLIQTHHNGKKIISCIPSYQYLYSKLSSHTFHAHPQTVQMN